MQAGSTDRHRSVSLIREHDYVYTIQRFSLCAPDADDVSHFMENNALEDSSIFHVSDVINVERHSSSRANCLVRGSVV